ncbi:hypothetical protein QAD02_022667, partial [Eretmocerus hayati]
FYKNIEIAKPPVIASVKSLEMLPTISDKSGKQDNGQGTSNDDTSHLRRSTRKKQQISYALELSESENSVTSDNSEMIFRFNSSSSSESEEIMNRIPTDSKLGENQVKLRRKRKKSKNHASGGEKPGDGKVRYLCTNQGCERSYTDKMSFYRHIHYECGKELRFKCGYCNYKSFRESDIRRHIIDTHQGCTYNILDTNNGSDDDTPTGNVCLVSPSMIARTIISSENYAGPEIHVGASQPFKSVDYNDDTMKGNHACVTPSLIPHKLISLGYHAGTKTDVGASQPFKHGDAHENTSIEKPSVIASAKSLTMPATKKSGKQDNGQALGTSNDDTSHLRRSTNVYVDTKTENPPVITSANSREMPAVEKFVEQDTGQDTSRGDASHPRRSTRTNPEFPCALEQPGSEYSITSEYSKIFLPFGSSSSSESEGEMERIPIASQLGRDQVELKNIGKKTRNHEKAGQKTGDESVRYLCTNEGCMRSYKHINSAHESTVEKPSVITPTSNCRETSTMEKSGEQDTGLDTLNDDVPHLRRSRRDKKRFSYGPEWLELKDSAILNQSDSSSDESSTSEEQESDQKSESEKGEDSTVHETEDEEDSSETEDEKSNKHDSEHQKMACANEGCNRSYKYKLDLYRHMRYECGKEPRFKCGHCEYRSPRARRIRDHITTKHARSDHTIIDTYIDKPFISNKSKNTSIWRCPNKACNHKFEEYPLLKSHLSKGCSSTAIDANFRDDVSSPLFQKSAALKTLEQENSSNYPESDCGEVKALKKKFLDAHQLTESNQKTDQDLSKHFFRDRLKRKCHKKEKVEEPTDRLVTLETNKILSNSPTRRVCPRQGLNGDEIKADREVYYPCKNKKCKRSYTNKKALDNHVRYECGKNPKFKCGYCDYKGSRPHTTRIHITRKHRGCKSIIFDVHNNIKIQ